MGIFSKFRKPRIFFTTEERKRIVDAIRAGERKTSGEIRVYVESKNKWVDPMDRAKELFYVLHMQDTQHRNAILIYVAMDHHEIAVFGDEGIYRSEPPGFWNNTVQKMVDEFRNGRILEGLIYGINIFSSELASMFPYEATTDKNELPDDIVFGK